MVRDLGSIPAANPLTPLIPILSEWDISVNWVLGVTALALVEIMVDKKLDELGLSKEGSFETRVQNLTEKAEKKGKQQVF
ncbi:MAG: hypothetical protein QW261_09115 [Candidatus Jordarchaeaceae archaeon]